MRLASRWKRTLLAYLAATTLTTTSLVVDAKNKNKPRVKVVILAGEANVEGFANLAHLHDLVTGQHTLNTTMTRLDTPERYQHLYDTATSQWTTRKDVFVTYEHSHADGWRHGPLHPQHWGHNPQKFGPELEIGHILGNVYKDEPVVIIKAGWAKRTLFKDFKSPSAKSTGTGVTGYQWYRLQNSMERTFTQMFRILGNQTMYRHAQIDLLGMIWWHGYTDMWKKTHADVYQENLHYFIQDVRSSLKRPYLPVVIAGIGGSGNHSYSPLEEEIRQAQKAVVKETVQTAYVDTEPYAVPSRPYLDINVHYYGRADTMIAISAALTKSLLELNDPDSISSSNRLIETDMEAYGSTMQTMLSLIMGLGTITLVAIMALIRTGHISERNAALQRPLTALKRLAAQLQLKYGIGGSSGLFSQEDETVPVREISLT